jgi:hypothetical protein
VFASVGLFFFITHVIMNSLGVRSLAFVVEIFFFFCKFSYISTALTFLSPQYYKLYVYTNKFLTFLVHISVQSAINIHSTTIYIYAHTTDCNFLLIVGFARCSYFLF